MDEVKNKTAPSESGAALQSTDSGSTAKQHINVSPLGEQQQSFPQKLQSSQILEINQTQAIGSNSLVVQENESPLMKRSSPMRNPQTVIAREAVHFNQAAVRSVNHSQISNDTQPDNRQGGILSSIETHSQQAHDLLRGGDIRIPGLGIDRQLSGMAHSKVNEDSFDMSSPGHRSSNGAYYNQLENSQQTIHNRATSSAQGKQQVLMDTGAKVSGISGNGQETQLFPTMVSPSGPNTKQSGSRLPGYSANGMIRVRNESLSSAGKVIGQVSQPHSAASNHNAQHHMNPMMNQKPSFTIQEMHSASEQHQHNKSVHISTGQVGALRNPTNESMQSMQLPDNLTVASLNSTSGTQPIRLKDMNGARPRGSSSDQYQNPNPNQVGNLRSGHGPRNQAVSNLLGSGQQPGNMTQMMRVSQYPSGTATGTQSNGTAHSLSPVKARASGLGSFAPSSISGNNTAGNGASSLAINQKKGSILSTVSPSIKGTNPIQQQNQVGAQVNHQTVSHGFGLTQMPVLSQDNIQQRQFQIQNGAQNAMVTGQQTTQVSNQNSNRQQMQPMLNKGVTGQRMTQGQFSGIAGHGTIYNNNQTNGRQQFQGQQTSNQNHQQLQYAQTSNQQLKNNQTQAANQAAVGGQQQQNMKPNEPGSLAGGNKPPQQVINRNNPAQGQNSFRGGPMNKPSPLKSQGTGGIMGSRQGVGGLGVTPNSNLHQGTNSILGNQMGAQQQMNPLFKMGGPGSLGQPSGGAPGHLNPHHTGMGMQGAVIGNGQNNTQANITGLSHPSTATHQNATHEHLNSTVGSHNKTNDTTKDSAPVSNQVPGVSAAAGGLANFGHGEGGFKMFERENFKFKDSIMIHVIDDSKNEKRDFTFSRSLLVKYMKYFDRCLKKISDNDEIDISIHCDAVIFEWLLNYIFAMEEYEKKQSDQDKFQRAVGNSVTPGWKLNAQKTNEDGSVEKEKNNFANSAIMQYGGPKLDIKNAVTILIPAEFLKIDRLVRECLDFIGEHIEEISRVQVDMSCINTNIIREMAKKVSLDRLDVLKERKDKIVSRLFMKKLELLLEKEKNHLYKCAYCNKLFTKKQRKVLSCRKGTSFIDSNGQMRAKHVIDKNWDLKKFVTFVRETYRISWKEIYWKVWSYLHLIKCERCMEYFPIAEMGVCRYHKQPSKIKMSATPLGSQYEYSCCEETVSVYQLLNSQKGDVGCQTQLHETRHIYNVPKNKEKKIIDRIIAHQLIILENPTSSFIDAIYLEEKLKSGQTKEGTGNAHTVRETTQGMTPMIVRPSSLNYKISLVEAVKNFISKERCGPDQIIEVELEEPSSKKMAHFEVLDDALFNLTYVPKYGKEKSVNVMSKNKRDSSHKFETQWEREEEQIRKKLEKNSINLMKSKIAQQARAEQSSTTQQQQQTDQDQQAQAAGAQQQQPNQPTPVQLSQNQIEEAKQMTQGKLKMYRRDRLYTSDKDRLDNLHNSLKNVRIVDEAAYFNSAPEGTSSPSKGTRAHRDGVPPTHKGGGKGDKGGGGGPGAGGAGGAAGGYTGYGGKGAGSNLHAPEKGGSANAKGSEYSSHNRGGQNRQNAAGGSGGMSAAAQAMHDAMFGVGSSPDPSIRVIKGLSDILEPKRSKATANTVSKCITRSSQSVNRSNSPHKNVVQGSSETAKVQRSPIATSVSRNKDPTGKPAFANRSMQPFVVNSNENASGMSTLMKSPIKNSLMQVPMGKNQLIGSAKTSNNGILQQKQYFQQNVMGDNTNTIVVIPSAFV